MKRCGTESRAGRGIVARTRTPYAWKVNLFRWILGWGLWAVHLQPLIAEDRLQGTWRVSLETPGGPLPFRLVIAEIDGSLSAQIVNGPERIDVPIEVQGENQFQLTMPHYDSQVDLRLSDDGRFVGQWTKRRGLKEIAQVPCLAVRGDQGIDPQLKLAAPDRFLGRWSVRFADSDDPAVGVFQRFESGQEVIGTFLTTTGDYRYLHGGVIGEQLVLSCFDGAHAFLFKAELDADNGLHGGFWSGNWYQDTWTGQRNANAKLPDGFAQTLETGAKSWEELQFPDLRGQLQSLGQAEFRGKVTLIEIFGSWCPNCHDEAAYLKQLRAKYGMQGLKVLGLAFELTGDWERDAKQVRRYIERFEIDYPILIAGLSDKAKASQAFPVLDRIRSFPTTLFLDSQGEIRAIYTGFSGPATGQEHRTLRLRFEALIEKLLAES